MGLGESSAALSEREKENFQGKLGRVRRRLAVCKICRVGPNPEEGCDCPKSTAETVDHGSRSARQECFPAHSPSTQHKCRRKGQDHVRIDKNQRCWSAILQRRHQEGTAHTKDSN